MMGSFWSDPEGRDNVVGWSKFCRKKTKQKVVCKRIRFSIAIFAKREACREVASLERTTCLRRLIFRCPSGNGFIAVRCFWGRRHAREGRKKKTRAKANTVGRSPWRLTLLQ